MLSHSIFRLLHYSLDIIIHNNYGWYHINYYICNCVGTYVHVLACTELYQNYV